MAKKKLIERKKKQREAKAKVSIVRKREQMRAQRRTERNIAKAEENTRMKQTPYMRPEKREALAKQEEEQNIAQLHRNLEILEALEKEYLKEQDAKAELNAKLESEGHVTLKEKLDALEAETKIWAEKHPEIQQPDADAIKND